MTCYRLYVRNQSLAGDIVALEEIEAPGDAEAVRMARRHDSVFLELWQGGRLVVALAPGGSRTEAASPPASASQPA